METTTSTTENKLQQVINQKLQESITGVEAKEETKKKTSSKKASEPKETKTPKATKSTKETKAKATPKQKIIKETKAKATVNLVEEVISNREVKYIYPEDCVDTLSRKKHRQQVRNKLHQFEREMFNLQATDQKAFKSKQKEYEAYKKEHLKQGATA